MCCNNMLHKEASTTSCSKTVLLLFISCLLLLGFVLHTCFIQYFFVYISSFAIIPLGKRELDALVYCLVVTELCLFLTVPCVGL